MNRLLLSAMTLLCLTSCFNEVKYETEYILKPHEQVESSGDYIPLEGVKVHAFAGTTEDWEVLSYDDAVAGLITSKTTGEQKSPFADSAPYNGSATEVSIVLDRVNVVLVAYDPSTEVFAYSDYEVPQNFSEVLVDIVFRSWKDATYTASTWTFVVPEKEDDTTTDDGATTPVE